jgi:hypothetical protein
MVDVLTIASGASSSDPCQSMPSRDKGTRHAAGRTRIARSVPRLPQVRKALRKSTIKGNASVKSDRCRWRSD